MANTAAFDGIYGNERLKSVLCHFIDGKCFPNSLILSGPEGSGKRTAAIRIAAAIACREKNRPCMECESCRKIMGGLSPDIFLTDVEGDKKSIGVASVREIRDTAFIRPNDLDVKVYIIRNADRMTEQAQNALLKLFEEPPEGVYFLLLCSASAGLLTTVRSRAPELRTECFTEERLKALLVAHLPEAETLARSDAGTFSRILHLAEGSYGAAVSLITDRARDKSVSCFDAAGQILAAYSAGDRGGLLLAMAAEAGSRDRLVSTLRLCRSALRDMAAVRRYPGVSLSFFGTAEEARLAGGSISLKKLLDAAELLRTACEQVSETNVNTQTAAAVIADSLYHKR